jgi:hypothetical protein
MRSFPLSSTSLLNTSKYHFQNYSLIPKAKKMFLENLKWMEEQKHKAENWRKKRVRGRVKRWQEKERKKQLVKNGNMLRRKWFENRLKVKKAREKKLNTTVSHYGKEDKSVGKRWDSVIEERSKLYECQSQDHSQSHFEEVINKETQNR